MTGAIRRVGEFLTADNDQQFYVLNFYVVENLPESQLSDDLLRGTSQFTDDTGLSLPQYQ